MPDVAKRAARYAKWIRQQKRQQDLHRTVVIGPHGHCIGLAVRSHLENSQAAATIKRGEV